MLTGLRRKSRLFPFLLLGACGLVARCTTPAPLDQKAFTALYSTPAPAAAGPLRVFHIGHSLVGRDMPAMLAQLAGPGHAYESQLGWGARMNAHWEPDVPVKGFETENAHPRYRDAHEAVASGDYDALVLTEGVEIRDAIKYGDSQKYLHEWGRAAWAANPEIRVYLYETWHPLDDPEGWLARLDRDIGLYWEDEILRRALAYEDVTKPIYVIPAGQVVARFVRTVEARGGVGPITRREDLFKKRNDGSPAADPGPEAARLMQDTVWEVVTNYPPTGVRR